MLLLPSIVSTAFMCLGPQSVMLGYVVTLEPSASFYFCFFSGHVLYFYNS